MQVQQDRVKHPFEFRFIPRGFPLDFDRPSFGRGRKGKIFSPEEYIIDLGQAFHPKYYSFQASLPGISVCRSLH